MAGSETSTAVLIHEQFKSGHQVFIASGRFSHSTPAKVFEIPIYNRSLLKRISNILALMELIRREKIDIVHAHSRAASWVSFWACGFTRTAFLSTFHGRQHLHFSNRHFNIYGPHCAAVCENIREQLLKETRVFEPDQIKVIRNGLPL